MKCHYTYYIDNGKKKRVFIPHCMGGEVHGKDGCTCQDITFASFEKNEYNKKLNEMQKRIQALECENKYLMQIIKKLK